jgi:hypothetical protein
MRRLGIVGTALLLGLTGSAWAADSIQMLPPKDIAAPNDVCPSGGDKLLSWDGSSALKCNKNLTTDSSGNLQAGGDLLAKGGIAAGVSRDQQGNASYKSILYSDGNISTVDTATVSIGTSALNATGIDTVNNLKNLGVCGAGYVLTKTGANSFACVNSGSFLANTTCTAGQVVTGFDANGAPVCAAASSVISVRLAVSRGPDDRPNNTTFPDPDCPAGYTLINRVLVSSYDNWTKVGVCVK